MCTIMKNKTEGMYENIFPDDEKNENSFWSSENAEIEAKKASFYKNASMNGFLEKDMPVAMP